MNQLTKSLRELTTEYDNVSFLLANETEPSERAGYEEKLTQLAYAARILNSAICILSNPPWEYRAIHKKGDRRASNVDRRKFRKIRKQYTDEERKERTQ